MQTYLPEGIHYRMTKRFKLCIYRLLKGAGFFYTGIYGCITVCVVTMFILCKPVPLSAAAPDSTEPVRIVIDPGHGGENLGADHNGYLEKDMTLIVAESMRDELEKYEGIEVYMTRTSDVDMSLEERIDYAEEVGADFFFCLHFNMSAEHDMYGAECWVSAFGECYARGMDFARIEMRQLTDLGLYDRGIKTRLGSKGQNYYGVLRMGDLAGIPTVIIEHCHLDNYNDEPFYVDYVWLVRYGKLDATAVAVYYGLVSDELGLDYSDVTYDPTPVPDHVVRPDDSPPDQMSVVYGEPYQTEGGTWVDVELSASDSESRMLYYSYSTDGGASWSERYRWQDDQGQLIGDSILTDTIHTAVPVSTDRDMYIVFKVYNLFNLDTVSDVYYLPKMIPDGDIYSEGESASHSSAGSGDTGEVEYTQIERGETSPESEGVTPLRNMSGLMLFGLIAVLSLAIILVLVILVYVIVDNRRKDNGRSRDR